MPIFQLAILFGYFFVLVILGMYGWHRFFLVREYTKHKDRAAGPVPHVADDASKQMETISFFKNVSMAGAAIVFFAALAGAEKGARVIGPMITDGLFHK